jgi:hypothetical protein
LALNPDRQYHLSGYRQKKPRRRDRGLSLRLPLASTTRSNCRSHPGQVNVCRSYSRAYSAAGARLVRNVSSPQFGQRGLSSTPKPRGFRGWFNMRGPPTRLGQIELRMCREEDLSTQTKAYRLSCQNLANLNPKTPEAARSDQSPLSAFTGLQLDNTTKSRDVILSRSPGPEPRGAQAESTFGHSLFFRSGAP